MKKKTKKMLQKTKKVIKAVTTFIKTTIKNYNNMKTKIKAILACCAITLIICSCGSTKVSVDKPAAGTQTTITVTTNNPISTSVDTNAEANFNLK